MTLRFTEYLNESKSAPIYHAAPIEAARVILRDNEFRALTNHSYYPTSFSPRSLGGWAAAKGISCTRSYAYAIKYMIQERYVKSFLIFELDQIKVAHHNRIVPVNYMASGADAFKASSVTRIKDNKNFSLYNESEEFIIGPIKDANRVINKIIVPDDDMWTLLTALEVYRDIALHPKLFYKGKFINA